MLRILEVLRLLKRFWGALEKVWKVPPVEDEAAFRAWLGAVTGLVAKLAQLSPTLVDDKLAELLRHIISDDKIWAAVYGLLVSLLGDADEGIKVGDADVESRVKAMALPGIDPVSLVTLILAIIRLFREWRK